MEYTKHVHLIRGIPGSGKSHYARELGAATWSADMFVNRDGGYNFDPAKIVEAHAWCLGRYLESLQNGEPNIAVANTFIHIWEMTNYLRLARLMGYRVTVVNITPKDRHAVKVCVARQTHDVPLDVVLRMWYEFEHCTAGFGIDHQVYLTVRE